MVPLTGAISTQSPLPMLRSGLPPLWYFTFNYYTGH